MAPRSRIVLLELLNDDPHNQHRTHLYPFVQGMHLEAGDEVRWLTLPAGRADRPAPYVVSLPQDGGARLLDELAAFGPAVLVVNETLDEAFAADARRAAPGVDLVKTGMGWDLPAAAWPTRARQAYPTALDFPRPRYESRLLGPREAWAPHRTQVMCGAPCVYNRPVAENPHYRGVDLAGATYRHGCAFCTHPDLGSLELPRTPALELALGQLRAFHKTAPAWRRNGRFAVDGGALNRRLGPFLQGFLDLGAPPSELYLTLRVDELLQGEDELTARLPALAEAGHSLHLWNIGMENLSATENERLNKGISPEQVHRATAALRRLERGWPGAFVWSRHGGYGMILFTPWTTLDDLWANARGLGELSLARCGALVCSRLQLRPGTAAESLARRDGLVVEGPEALATVPPATVPPDLSCLTDASDQELVWRFAHPDAHAAYCLMLTLFPHHGPPACEGLDDPAEALALVVEVVRDNPGADHAALLGEVVAKVARP